MGGWFQEAEFGMMVHWGLYSLPAGEWKGQRMPHIGEWAQSYFRIPNEEYHALAEAFNPILFDADAWVRLARDAGMRYIVVTAKHHEGFAMFDSKVDDFTLVKATPYGRDAIALLAEACQKYGLRLGLYYSQELDWSDPDGGGYGADRLNVGCMSWTNDWDFPDASRKSYSRCFERKILPQVEELLTRYGDIALMWFDTPFDISPEESLRLYRLVKRLQPDCLVNSRIGNGIGDYRSTGDNQTDFNAQLPQSASTDASKGLARASESGVQTGLYECPATLNDTWGYKAFDQNWKSAARLAELRRSLNARGINYLLNVGPDYLGRIPAPSEAILRQMGKG